MEQTRYMKKMTIAALVFLTLSACKENNVHQASLRSVQTVAPEVSADPNENNEKDDKEE